MRRKRKIRQKPGAIARPLGIQQKAVLHPLHLRLDLEREAVLPFAVGSSSVVLSGVVVLPI